VADDRVLREHLLKLLESADAHLAWDAVIEDLPQELRGQKPAGAPHTPWQLLEHLRIAQWDILEFSRDGSHVSPPFPEGYWPPTETPPDRDAWERSVDRFRADLQAMKELVSHPATDLYAPIPHGTGQTILREVLLVADHNAYHLGQLLLLRRLLGGWSA
jgi:uncharacterized damage-inducible protein DinB